MAIDREFLGWNRPFLESTADWLLERAPEFDLQDLVLAFPGRRAEKLLLEILVNRAEKAGKMLIPPRAMLTLGNLPEYVISSSGNVLSDFQRRLIWTEVLKSFSAEELSSLLPVFSASSGMSTLLGLAGQIDDLYTELSGAGLDFKDVSQRCLELPEIYNDQRWEILNLISTRYLETLTSFGISDRYQLRFQALEGSSLNLSQEMILVAAADLNNTTKRLLEKVDGSITALINAPAEKAEFFDQFGSIVTEAWLTENIDIEDHRIKIESGPEDQAREVSGFLTSLDGNYSAEEITVGVGDEKLVPFIFQQLEAGKVPIRYGAGTSLSMTSPWRVLKAVSRFLLSGEMTDLGSLIRCAEIQAWLVQSLKNNGKVSNARDKILVFLDRYQDRHLQAKAREKLAGRDRSAMAADDIKKAVLELLSDFDGSKSIEEWSAAICSLIIKIYQKPEFPWSASFQRVLEEFFQGLSDILSDLIGFEELVGRQALKAEEVLAVVLRELAERNLPPLPDVSAVEVLGWLELQLDTAPVLVVAGFNEGMVPKSVNSDPFLPDSLRAKLGLIDNQRRYARDAYILTSLVNSKKELKIIGGRRGIEAEPLSPSRLLFACSGKEMARRVKAFLVDEKGPGESIAPQVERDDSPSSYPIPPKPEPLANPLEVISVSSFKDYLKSPFRFYLRQVLDLEILNDRTRELDPLAFGILAHQVLNDFGRSEAAASVDPETIEGCLISCLKKTVQERFGGNVLPAVLVQIEQLKARLQSFARWQASWAAEGWEIKNTELDFSEKDFEIDLPQGVMGVRGRIDRIDYNCHTGAWAVLDYKTGDAVSEPERSHRRRGKWVDLQLPIYHYFLRKKNYRGAIRCGYITLCSELDKIKVRFADWGEEDLEEARTVMVEVAQGIKEGCFDPTEEDRRIVDDFSVLCGMGQFLSQTEEEQ